MKKDKQQFGQYMTPQLICDFMVEMIEHDKSDSVLEPACGDGAFLKSLKNHSFFNVKAYEIDQKIIDRNFNVQNESFVSSSIDEIVFIAVSFLFISFIAMLYSSPGLITIGN